MDILRVYIYFAAACALITLIKWRMGPWLMLLVGLLSDPVRKLTPDNPPYISVIFLFVFLAFLISLVRHKRFYFKQRIFNYYPALKKIMPIFLTLFFINTMRPIMENMSYLPLVAYGCAQYIALFVCSKTGFDIANDYNDIIRFADVFMITLLPFLLTVFISVGMKNPGPVFGVMGFEGKSYFQFHSNMALPMLSGVFRSPEIMGWYAMTASISSLFLLAYKRKKLWSVLYYLSAFLISSACILFSGRRKFFLGLFLFTFLFIMLVARKNRKQAMASLVIFAVVFSVFLFYTRKTSDLTIYLRSSTTAVTELRGRLQGGTVGSVFWAIQRDGLWGRGLGTSAQGARHFDATITEGHSIEAGPGKIISELGVFGAITLIMILASCLFKVYKITAKGRYEKTSEITVIFLLSICLTHIAEFTLSHQVYGDPLIAILTGMTFGFMLAVPKINTRITVEKVIIQQDSQMT